MTIEKQKALLRLACDKRTNDVQQMKNNGDYCMFSVLTGEEINITSYYNKLFDECLQYHQEQLSEIESLDDAFDLVDFVYSQDDGVY